MDIICEHEINMIIVANWQNIPAWLNLPPKKTNYITGAFCSLHARLATIQNEQKKKVNQDRYAKPCLDSTFQEQKKKEHICIVLDS